MRILEVACKRSTTPPIKTHVANVRDVPEDVSWDKDSIVGRILKSRAGYHRNLCNYAAWAMTA